MQCKFVDEEARRLYGGILSQGSEGSAGFDLRVSTVHPFGIIGTGVRLAIPKGMVGLVFIRSGIGFKKGHTLANSVGVIDSDYRGEIMLRLARTNTIDELEGVVVTLNTGESKPIPCFKTIINYQVSTMEISQGERVAQIVVVPHMPAVAVEYVSDLDETVRGLSGFGSSGEQ